MNAESAPPGEREVSAALGRHVPDHSTASFLGLLYASTTMWMASNDRNSWSFGSPNQGVGRTVLLIFQDLPCLCQLLVVTDHLRQVKKKNAVWISKFFPLLNRLSFDSTFPSSCIQSPTEGKIPIPSFKFQLIRNCFCLYFLSEIKNRGRTSGMKRNKVSVIPKGLFTDPCRAVAVVLTVVVGTETYAYINLQRCPFLYTSNK